MYGERFPLKYRTEYDPDHSLKNLETYTTLLVPPDFHRTKQVSEIMNKEDESDGNNSHGTPPNASEGERQQLRRQSMIETYTYRDFAIVSRLDNYDNTNDDNDGGGGGGGWMGKGGTASSKTTKASAFKVTDKLDAMLRDPGEKHSVVYGSRCRCIYGTPSRPSTLSSPLSFSTDLFCSLSTFADSHSPSLFSSFAAQTK